MSDKKKLWLVDGSGYIYRAFYAIPNMTRPTDKMPVNAVYGFTSMIMNLVADNKAECLAVVFDAKRRNFRNDLYPDYKANRREAPPELIAQFPLIREAVQAFNIASVELEGYEADDLIASYAQKAALDGYDVTIVSADKDLMQLMTDDIHLYDPMKKRLLTEEDVEKKFGVKPDKVVQVQALMGDTSDNIPGVKGIGPKTAAELILRFNTVDNLYQHLDEVLSLKVRSSLRDNEDKARLSQQLVCLKSDIDLPVEIEKFCSYRPDVDKVQSFLSEYGFKSLQGRISSFMQRRCANICLSKPIIPTNYECICDVKTLKKWMLGVEKTKTLSFDIFKTSEDVFCSKIVGVSLAFDVGNACYIPLTHYQKMGRQDDLFADMDEKELVKQISVSDFKDVLLPILKNSQIRKIGFDLKNTLIVLENAFCCDIDAGGQFDDVGILSYDLKGPSAGKTLDEISLYYGQEKMLSLSDVCGQGRQAIDFSETDLQKASAYMCQRADMIYRLSKDLFSELENQNLMSVYQTMDRPLLFILKDMEKKGVRVNRQELYSMQVEFEDKISSLKRQIYDLAGEEFNINSPQQLGDILFSKMKLNGGKKTSKTGQWITDSDVLEKLSSEGVPLASYVLNYRQYTKLKSTYVDALLEKTSDVNDRVHTSYLQTITNTGRLSSVNPNLQNIPIRTQEGRRIRSAFIASDGHVLMSADYSQVELRLMAAVANVAGLKDAFAKGQDIHASTASHIFGVPIDEMTSEIRRQAKAINFGIIYGISAFGLANQLSISRTDAQKYINSYFEKYPEIKEYMDKTIHFASTKGYVETPFGRRCYISAFENQSSKGFASRAAINAPLQGGAADIIKKVMLQLPDTLKKVGLGAKMLLQVHDELIFDVPENEVEQTKEIVKNMMENVVHLSVPLIVDIGVGKNWTEAH